MRPVIGALLVISLGGGIGLTATAHADDYPIRKPGLWDITMTLTDSKMPPQQTRLCIDAASDAALYKMGMQGAGANCSRHDMTRSGSTLTTDSVCAMGNRQITTHAVMVFSGETSYHTDIRSHFDPPMMAGHAESTMTQDAKWAGPCPAEMQPGDMLLPNGNKINVLTARKNVR